MKLIVASVILLLVIPHFFIYAADVDQLAIDQLKHMLWQAVPAPMAAGYLELQEEFARLYREIEMAIANPSTLTPEKIKSWRESMKQLITRAGDLAEEAPLKKYLKDIPGFDPKALAILGKDKFITSEYYHSMSVNFRHAATALNRIDESGILGKALAALARQATRVARYAKYFGWLKRPCWLGGKFLGYYSIYQTVKEGNEVVGGGNPIIGVVSPQFPRLPDNYYVDDEGRLRRKPLFERVPKKEWPIVVNPDERERKYLEEQLKARSQ